MIKKFHAYYKSYQAKDAIKEGNMHPAGFNYKKRSDTYIDRWERRCVKGLLPKSTFKTASNNNEIQTTWF